MKNNKSSTDIQGVECQVCEKESFRIFPRKIVIAPGLTAKIKCCPRCAGVIDARQEVKNAERYKIRAEQQEISFSWANSLYGKRVIVFWQDGVHPVNFNKHDPWTEPKPIKQVRGIAYRHTNASGGWGQVKVILDSAENKRVTLIPEEYSSEPNLIPIIDGQRFGLSLDLIENDSYYTLVTWGGRRTIALDEAEQR